MAIELRDRSAKVEDSLRLPEYTGKKVKFEGIDIQWEKGEWEFNHPTLGKLAKPTYPLLNPLYWNELAQRFKDGETAAVFMLGNFGVVKKLESPEWEQGDKGSADALFDKVKKRPREQNFVALSHPEDAINLINLDKVTNKRLRRQLRFPEGREQLYPGPLHVILPAKTADFINKALIRKEDGTIAVFWAKHFGFEGLVDAARKKIKHGVLGGGSLNIHGKEPCYNKNELFQEMSRQPDWLEEIDLVILDDIAEAGTIGRSHTMVRYSGEKPEVIRVGSLSVDRIRTRTGHDIQLAQEVKYASSVTPYLPENNASSDEKVAQVLERIQRFSSFLRGNLVHR